MPESAENPQPERQPSVQIREACRSCGRKVSKHSRQGLYWKCPHCARYNLGPKLREELTREPEPGARRRVSRREAAAERRPERGAKAQTGGAKPPAAPAAVDTPSQSPSPPAPVKRRPLLDRLLYGEE